MAAFGAGFGGTAAFGGSTTFGQGGGWEPSPGEVVHAMVGGRQGHGGGFTGGRWVEAQVQTNPAEAFPIFVHTPKPLTNACYH
jgi:hypothetical protein